MESTRRFFRNFFVIPSVLLLCVLHISSSLTFSDVTQNEEEQPPSKDPAIVFGMTPPGYKIKVDFLKYYIFYNDDELAAVFQKTPCYFEKVTVFFKI